MAASTSVPLSKQSRAQFIQYYKSIQNLQNTTRSNLRARLEKADRSYQRVLDKTYDQQMAAAANAAGDTDKFQNITVPVVMPQIEVATTYQTSVFLTGSPIFGVVAAPEFMDEALQLETVLEEQSIRGGWARQLMMFFRDGFKHNLSFAEVAWEQEVTSVVETDISAGQEANSAATKKLLWSGNALKRLDLYNTFVDSSVPPTEVYKHGEFAGYTEFMSRIRLKSFVAALPNKIISEIRPAFESGSAGAVNIDSSAFNFYAPDINPDVSNLDSYDGSTNWLKWAGINTAKPTDIQYKDAYEVTTLYCKVLPSEFSLAVANSNTPQIYKLIIVNHEHIIYAERQTNAHGYIPIFCGQPLEDGLRYQTKSMAANAEPFQEVASAYMNSILHSRRRAVTDRVLYDPSRITAAHINSANPSAKIPVRPAAYGKNIGESVYQFPYREDQAGFSMQQIQQLLSLANNLTGQNQASQGQFVKGNKTLHEFESVMDNANGRDQMASILYEFQVFVPMKLVFKLNILQYQGGTTVYNRDKQVAVEIDPVALRKAVLEFKVADGLTPASKIINSETFSVAMQVLGSSPEIAQGYNTAPLFSYIMKTQGADLSPFEKSPEQLAYEQAMGQWQQIAAMAIEKSETGELPEGLPPQPLPEQYGYQPASQKPTPPEAQGAQSAQSPATP